jgi:ketosteroid isomerase-like protein
MADLAPVIETMEHRWMRAWANGDIKELKALTARNFILLTASKPPAILDKLSWIDAAANRYHCSAYRFGEIFVRDYGAAAVFSAPLELKATMDGRDWSGAFFVTDLWRKGRVRRSWKLVHRVISRVDDRSEVPKAIRALQLWR